MTLPPSTPAQKSKIPAPSTAARATRSRVNNTPSLGIEHSTPATGKSKLVGKVPMTTGKIGRGFGISGDGMSRIASFASTSSAHTASSGDGTETLQTYCRIRPSTNPKSEYLSIASPNRLILKPHAATNKPTSTYDFNRVFPPSTPQSEFFESTALPLVEQALNGQGSLVFSYGVSNSGKTYTIQGEETGDHRGVIPRSLDVIFKNIENMHYPKSLKLVGSSSVVFQHSDEGEEEERPVSAFLQGKGGMVEAVDEQEAALNLDKNYSYAVFLSYAEVYTDKIFDLLEGVPTNKDHRNAVPTAPSTPSQKPALHKAPSFWSKKGGLFSAPMASPSHPSFGFGSRMSIVPSTSGGKSTITRQALRMGADENGENYIKGLKNIRVRSRAEAQAIFRSGQGERKVFGTMGNRVSSRSHGIFEVKVVRIHNGMSESTESVNLSRLCIVDLAGQERQVNSGAEGVRFDEGKAINSDIFALTTCLKVLREQQAVLAHNMVTGQKKRLPHVSYRNNHLTRVFERFFKDGRVVMIVAINPDTEFFETQQVCQLSALASDVQTSTVDKIRHPFAKGFEAFKNKVQTNRSSKIKILMPVPRPVAAGVVRLAEQTAPEGTIEEVELEVVEAEPESDDDESDEQTDALVEALFEQNRHLQEALYDEQIRSAAIEAEVRKEVCEAYEAQMAKMEESHRQRLEEEILAHETKADRKLDIMQRSHAAALQAQAQYVEDSEDSEDEDDVFEEARSTTHSMVDIDLSLSARSSTGSPSPLSRNAPMLPADLISMGSPLPTQAIHRELVVEVPTIAVIRAAEEVEESVVAQSAPISPPNEAMEAGSLSVDNIRSSTPESSADSQAASEGANSEASEIEDQPSDDSEDEESSFAMSSSSAKSTPVKRPARRTTGGRKSQAPARPASPVKVKAPVKAKPSTGQAAKGKSTKAPMRESLSQPKIEEPISDGEQEADMVPDKVAREANLPKGTTFVPNPDEQDAGVKKKKRKLGGKVIVPDDDGHADGGKNSVNIRRFASQAGRG